MKKVFKISMSLILSLALIITTSSIMSFAKDKVIKDLQNTDEAYDKVQWCLGQGYFSLTLSKFYPDKNVKRGEFAVILSKLRGDNKNLANPSTPTFKDVSKKDQFFRYIETVKDYMTVYKSSSGTVFKPNNYLTREDALMSIVKLFGFDSEDAITNNEEGDVSLDEIIDDYNKISPALLPYCTVGIHGELITLREDSSGTFFDPKKNITRKDLAVLIYNAYQGKDYNKDDANEE